MANRRPKNKHLFTYFNGEKDRTIDAQKYLMELATIVSIDGERAKQGDVQASIKIVENMRSLMKILPYDEDTGLGIPDGEVLEVYEQMLDQVNDLKKNTKLVATSLPPTEQQPLHSTEKHSSDFGLTWVEPKSDKAE